MSSVIVLFLSGLQIWLQVEIKLPGLAEVKTGFRKRHPFCSAASETCHFSRIKFLHSTFTSLLNFHMTLRGC